MNKASRRERTGEIICRTRPEGKLKSKVNDEYHEDLELKYCRIKSEDFYFPFVPDVDYEQVGNVMEDLNHNPRFDENGLILPRRAVMPHIDTRKDINRELMFNCKTGKSVFNQRSELSRALEKHRINQSKKEADQERMMAKSEMERALSERARRLEEIERSNKTQSSCDTSQVCNPEFLRVHAKVKNRIEATH